MLINRMNVNLAGMACKAARTSAQIKTPKHLTVKIETFKAFEFINYRFLWASTALFSGGFWLQQVVVGWLAYSMTQSPLVTSIVLGLDALPILLGAPLGGVISEKFDKKKLIIWVYIYQAILSLIFGVVIIAGKESISGLFIFVLLMGISWTINDPSRISLLASIIPKDGMINAFALNSMAFSIMRLCVPAIGGLLIAWVGVGPLFIVQSMLTLSASSVLYFINVKEKPANREPFKKSIRNLYPDLKLGLSFATRQPLIIGLTFTTLLMMILVIPFVQGLMPVYAAEIFNSGPERLGLLLSAAGVGSLISTVFIASLKEIRKPGKVIFIIFAFLVMLMIAMSQNSNYYVGLITFMLLSGCIMAYFSISSATLQRFLPNEVRARVTGLYMMVWGLIPVGSLVAGTIANILGPKTATLTGALILISVITGGIFFCKELLQHDSQNTLIYNFQHTTHNSSTSYKVKSVTEI